MRQSGPTTTPLPIETNGPTRQPEPISASASMTTYGPISADGSTNAVSTMTAEAWTPGQGGGEGWNSAATRAQASYTAVVVIGMVVAGTRSSIFGCTITAPAIVFSSA